MNESIRTAHEIRRAYIDFFVDRDHVEVPSAPLVPKGDSTLLFTSAGMVQFKEYYLQPDNLPYTRATSVQKCLRAGDLDSVGRTLRHHTFFEMLGNFSFGDYFKHEAIEWAWEFTVSLLDLPEEKLSVSIFEDDDEAFRIWNEIIGLEKDRIFRLGRDDNFWGPVGKTGVCGPCSEIYFDTGSERGCGREACAPGCDCDRYLEFWNLVFPQYFLEENGRYRPLERPGIDTGLGLERLATIMQGVEDNYHTDLFQPLIEELYAAVPSSHEMRDEDRMGVNMVADHVRALVFTISEGVYPSNEGRGYLLRRLLRRAMTKYYSFGVEEPFLHKLTDAVVDVMRIDYPELEERRRDTAMIICSEEESFFRTLEDGKSRFASIVGEVKSEGGGVIDGDKVFLLYDTFGFPLELTVALAAQQDLAVDEDGFEAAMARQRRKAQESSAFAGDEQELVSMIEVSEGESSIFVGYETTSGESAIRSYRPVAKSSREDIDWKQGNITAFELILDRTPFYATSGGQIADKGWLDIAGLRLEIRDVFKRGGEIVHLVESEGDIDAVERAIAAGKSLRVTVDDERRLAIASNHTATHLLHAALRSVVGRHVAQGGSLVDEHRLRFDFSHFQAVSADARRSIEEKVNGWIREMIDVRVEWMDYQDAVDSGAIALFDEKYGAKVRVIRIGDVSTELCGGTHVDNTGRIGMFIINSESSVAAGVRRIEAVSGAGALEYVHANARREEEILSMLKVSQADLVPRLQSILDEMDRMRKDIRRLERGEVGGELDRIVGSAADVNGILVACGRITVKDVSALRNQADVFRSRVESGVAVLSSPLKGKMQYIVAVTDDLIDKHGLDASAIVRELGAVAGGGGGGKKHLAQLGTKDAGSEDRVFEAVPDVLRQMITKA
jgi:alanyl-tRNA synthetase